MNVFSTQNRTLCTNMVGVTHTSDIRVKVIQLCLKLGSIWILGNTSEQITLVCFELIELVCVT